MLSFNIRTKVKQTFLRLENHNKSLIYIAKTLSLKGHTAKILSLMNKKASLPFKKKKLHKNLLSFGTKYYG